MIDLNHPLFAKIAGLGVSTAIRLWMPTLNCRGALYDVSVDPARPECHRHHIYVMWHEYMTLPVYLRHHCDMSLLMSRHRDADILSRVSMHFGYDFVRGSTARGGERAIREMMEHGRSRHLIITPDGPRGPRRKMAAGCVYVASRLQIPIVLMAVGYDRPWRLPTWDQFAIPRPFSRARTILTPAIWVPPDLDREALEHWRQRLEQLLARLTLEAETWAAAGTRKEGEIAAVPQTKLLAARAAKIFPGSESPPAIDTRARVPASSRRAA